MKLLLDQNLSYKLAKMLDDGFPASGQVKLLGLQAADDRDIWEYARQNGFTLVTKDADYSEWSALLGHPPKVLWLRSGHQPASYLEQRIRSHLDEILAFGLDPAAGCLEIY